MREKVLTFSFFIILILPLLGNLFNFTSEDSKNENRALSKFPVAKLKAIDRFSIDFEKYLNDNIGFRNAAIKAYNRIHLRLFKKSFSEEKVVIGKEGWLFSGGKEIEIYTGRKRFSEVELDTIESELLQRHQFIDSIGAKMYLAIIPQKHEIYPEYLPWYTYKKNKQDWSLQVRKKLGDNPNLHLIDLHTPLKDAKESEAFPLYQQTDNHWNRLGGFIASKVLIRNLAKDFPELDTISQNEFELEHMIWNHGNLATMLDIGDEVERDKFYINYTDKQLEVREVPNQYPPEELFPYPDKFALAYESDRNDVKIVVMRESFASHGQTKAMPPYFGRSLFVFDSWEYKLNKHILLEEKPDIVLFLVLERNLDAFLQFRAF